MKPLQDVSEWIKTAKQQRNNRNLANYIGFLTSECAELIAEIGDTHPKAVARLMEQLSIEIRNGEFDESIAKANRCNLADHAFDTTWTAIGVMDMLGAPESIWAEGCKSNFSKFTVIDNKLVAVLDNTGKVTKPITFRKPDFSKIV